MDAWMVLFLASALAVSTVIAVPQERRSGGGQGHGHINFGVKGEASFKGGLRGTETNSINLPGLAGHGEENGHGGMKLNGHGGASGRGEGNTHLGGFTGAHEAGNFHGENGGRVGLEGVAHKAMSINGRGRDDVGMGGSAGMNEGGNIHSGTRGGLGLGGSHGSRMSGENSASGKGDLSVGGNGRTSIADGHSGKLSGILSGHEERIRGVALENVHRGLAGAASNGRNELGNENGLGFHGNGVEHHGTGFDGLGAWGGKVATQETGSHHGNGRLRMKGKIDIGGGN